MSENGNLSHLEINSRKSSFRKEILSRRELSRRLLGVSATWSMSGLHPVWKNLLTAAPLDSSVDVDLASTTWKPLFLQAYQAEALESFSEAIVPGSTKAFVTQFIDLLLSVDTPEHQAKFLSSLSKLQAEAKQRYGSVFQRLAASQRDSLLRVVSSSAENSVGRESFEDLKEWIAGSYYSSEIGMKELGWTPNRFFLEFPRCSQATE